MAARRTSSFDDKRARIAELASVPRLVAAAELRRFLGDKNGYLVGEAARVAHEMEMSDLAPDMVSAFERLMVDGATTDKGCMGKGRILEALLAFEAYVPDVYLKGIRYVQREPAFPQPVDTAAAIRGMSAQALVQIDHRTALLDITPLLADPEPLARAEGARALARSGIDDAGAVLHLKALTGDAEPDVLQACYEGLLRLAPTRYLPFVSAALSGDEARADAAALALGESRLREAFPILRGALEAAAGPRERQTLSMAIGLCRSEEALAYLMSIVESGPEGHASAAIAALSLHRHDEALVDRVKKAVAERRSRRLQATLEEQFGR